MIFWVPAPLAWERWPEAKAMLQPALERADDQQEILERNHILSAVMDGDDLLACCTWRLTEDDTLEVVLVGGRDRHRWLAELDTALGAEASGAGATRLMAMGRRGWLRELQRLGWDSLGEVNGSTVYCRNLNESAGNAPMESQIGQEKV